MKEPSFIKLSSHSAPQKSKYKFKRTGNVAVDTVAALINHYKGVIIQEIYLCPSYYAMFEEYVKFQMKKQNQVFIKGQRMSHSGVDIQSRFMGMKSIQWVFENNKTGES